MACKTIKKDLSFVWHPYTHVNKRNPLLFTQGKGVYLFDAKGKKYLDAISSWWVNIHGHCHPYIIKKMMAQARELEHTIFTDFTHLQAVTYAERLLSHLPKGFSKVFYSDNGSTAVEAALKMAIQFTKKKRFITFKGGYHGDTFGSMSTSKGVFNKPFWSFLFPITAITLPIKGYEEKAVKDMKKELSKCDVIAFLYEPMIQGASGMRIYCRETMSILLKMCKEQNVLLIADEVMTGFGRTGPLFASSYYNTSPDIMTFAKGITGGFLPLGVTACQEEIFKAISIFFHGHSYTANPISLSAANASLDLLTMPASVTQRKNIAKNHYRFCKRSKRSSKYVAYYLGTILRVAYDCKNTSYFSPIKEKIKKHFLKRQILVRPLGNILYIMPPYCIKNKELEVIYDAIDSFS